MNDYLIGQVDKVSKWHLVSQERIAEVIFGSTLIVTACGWVATKKSCTDIYNINIILEDENMCKLCKKILREEYQPMIDIIKALS